MGEEGRKKKKDREMQMGLMGCCLSLKQGPAFTCGCDGWKSRPAKHTTIQGIHLQVSRVILAPILPHVHPHSSLPLRCSSPQGYACGPLQYSTRAHHASSRTAHRDARSTPHPSPPSTSPVRPESRLLLSSSHPVLHLHPFILDLSVLSSVVRYIQLVLLYVVSATVCCCLSLAFCCLSLFTAGLPLSAAAY